MRPTLNELDLPSDAELEKRVSILAGALTGRGWSVATAESCTGGWIAKVCTDRAGSSAWFERGVVSYSNRSKCELLGVQEATLGADGAVSRAVALQMAAGARDRFAVEAALAVTGVAGPDGGTPDKPVGTVWFAWAVAARPVEAECVVFAGDREAVRRQTVAHALQGLIDRLAR
jgi:nicotinamide-nucleotide amidase